MGILHVYSVLTSAIFWQWSILRGLISDAYVPSFLSMCCLHFPIWGDQRSFGSSGQAGCRSSRLMGGAGSGLIAGADMDLWSDVNYAARNLLLQCGRKSAGM